MAQGPPINPFLHEPAAAPTIDTSPQALGLEGSSNNDKDKDKEEHKSGNESTALDRSLSASGSFVKRAFDKTAGMLSIPGTRTSSNASSSPKRLLSVSRKNKGRETEQAASSSATTGPPPEAQQDDEPSMHAPFLSLSSMLTSFRGDASMRMGTQTLIQALQAIPWTDDPDHDDDATHTEQIPIHSESDDEESPNPIASSIHTIYRSLGRFRRHEHTSVNNSNNFETLRQTQIPESASSEQRYTSEREADDFEAPTPRPPDLPQPNANALQNKTIQPRSPNLGFPSAVMTRSGSMATVKAQKRSQLALKLRDVFEIDAIEEVLAEMPCFVLRSVLLQGYMYLTNSYLCFFAHMPSREGQVVRSGSLWKKAHRTKRWIRHWFVLKDDVLSWYQSSSDPYFPHGMIDLRYAISCEPHSDKNIKLRTNQRNITLAADSTTSRDTWVKTIQKVIFKAQNSGESVKIAIPYSAILDVEQSSAFDFSETIEVKVLDDPRSHSVDSYLFTYFNDISTALDKIRDAVRAYRASPLSTTTGAVLDTTARSPATTAASIEGSTSGDKVHLTSSPSPSASSLHKSPSSASSHFRLTSLLRPLRSSQDTSPIAKLSTPPEDAALAEGFTHVSTRGSSSFVPVTTSPPPPPPQTDRPLPATRDSVISTSSTSSGHTYPPSTSGQSGSLGLWSVPSWLRGSRRSADTNSSNAQAGAEAAANVSEVYSPSGEPRTSRDMGHSILEANRQLDPIMVQKFHSYFAFDERETLLGYFSGFIFRLLPLPGRLYVSKNYFCFKSTGPLSTRTSMILPIKDILSIEKSKAQIGHYGLIVIIKGHEELFFEFRFEDRRDAFHDLLARQIEDVRRRLAEGASLTLSPSQRDALILEEFEMRTSPTGGVGNGNGNGGGDDEPRPSLSESMSDSLPAVMFTSHSSTFLTFKPEKSLRFTFLTIGSRGDVQPYIALGKGLMADGHRVKIATHLEFKDWVESYGIEYGYVGGDPAELMRICVENGMFTVSFLKETLQKFRGWLDDLLKTSWEACQDSDVLVESPSAMGGLHIAEALKIPYFRAFTMTWTRTRAYPHAFAVPEHKMGGGYNYMSYVMFDQVFWRATAGQINRWRRNMLHLGSTSLEKMEPHKIPFLYNFSPSVVPPPLDWPEWIRVTGYWFLDEGDSQSQNWTPPTELVQFIDNAHAQGKKVVYIGFGSIVVSDPRAMTHSVIQAVVESGVYAILSKGWSDRLQVKKGEAAKPEEPLPKQIFPVTSVPHDWLFKKIDAACHHGGAGTTGASLRAGIPTIIKPFFGDQYFWADRVEALGVGSGVRKLTVEHLRDALITATTDIKQIDRAKLLGEQIRSENGVATAIESIYRDLEYAKTLIKHNPLDENAPPEAEDATIRNQDVLPESRPSTPEAQQDNSGYLSTPSEEWSVVSELDASMSMERERRRSSVSSKHHHQQSAPQSPKRGNFTATVLSVLPDSLTTPSAK